jgi:mannitol/fructose-specific phosphotransferase system IIA component (Ntr-type)
MSKLTRKPTVLSLSALITEDTAQARVSVSNWEEATDYVGNLLLRAGKIQAGYISAMKLVLKEIGPYAVIAPGIVLLHARPEDGVLEPCLGLITLSTPVPFGHSTNDPVDIILALGATDKQSHIVALQKLGNLLGNNDCLQSIRAAPDGRTLVAIFSEDTK